MGKIAGWSLIHRGKTETKWQNDKVQFLEVRVFRMVSMNPEIGSPTWRIAMDKPNKQWQWVGDLPRREEAEKLAIEFMRKQNS